MPKVPAKPVAPGYTPCASQPREQSGTDIARPRLPPRPSATGTAVVLHARHLPGPVPHRPAAGRRVAVHRHVPGRAVWVPAAPRPTSRLSAEAVRRPSVASAGSNTPAGGVPSQSSTGDCDQRSGSRKSAVPPENTAPLNRTIPPENLARLGSPLSRTTPVKSRLRPCQDTAASGEGDALGAISRTTKGGRRGRRRAGTRSGHWPARKTSKSVRWSFCRREPGAGHR
jgi:hypothetical protein